MASHSNVALVTGASTGIGRATALALHRAGLITCATARRTEAIADLKAQGLRTFQLDVTDETSMMTALRQVEHEAGPIAVLVNNAGYGLNGPAEELDLREVRREFETNVFGLLRMSQLVLPGMRHGGWGRIINVGSIGGTFTAPGAGAYHASKYAVEALSDAMRYEVQRFGVDVVLIQPTGVYTPFFAKINDTMRDTGADSPYAAFKDNLAQLTTRMHTGRGSYGLVTADDVAKVIVAAVRARRPRTRYKVGLSAHIYAGVRRILSDRMWDRVMGWQLPMQPLGTTARTAPPRSP
jgi:NAD(P)-dependent dehydrogenase (short-subunit alcohol dehydrogenase family)